MGKGSHLSSGVRTEHDTEIGINRGTSRGRAIAAPGKQIGHTIVPISMIALRNPPRSVRTTTVVSESARITYMK
jgi:hypothetical protein